MIFGASEAIELTKSRIVDLARIVVQPNLDAFGRSFGTERQRRSLRGPIAFAYRRMNNALFGKQQLPLCPRTRMEKGSSRGQRNE